MLKKTGLFLLSLIFILNGQDIMSQEDSQLAAIDYMDGRVSTLREESVREGLNIYTVTADITNTPSTAPGWWTRGVSAGSDLDEDGYQEIIITDYSVRGVHVYEVTDDNTLEWVVSFEDSITSYVTTPRHVITGDLDGNGRGEIIYLGMRDSNEENNGINIWEWDGVPGSDQYTRYVIPIIIDDPIGGVLDRYYGDRSLNIGDIDGDGQVELMICNNGSNPESDVFLIGSLMGTLESGFFDLAWEYINIRSLSGDFGGSPWGQPNFGDMDGDGSTEAYFFAWDHATLLTLEVEDYDVYMPQSIVMLDSAYTDKVVYGTTHVADINGDGHDELFGGTYPAGWLFQVSGGNDVSQIDYPSGLIQIYTDSSAYWDVTGGDVDGDGLDEIFSIDYDHARITQWDWNGETLIPSTLVEWPNLMGGFSLDFADDLDGDGYPELIQGFLEAPYTEGNPDGILFAVIEFRNDDPLQVEFNVDMNIQLAEENFDPATDVVELRGDFNGWGENSTILMLERGSTGIYRAVVDFSQIDNGSTLAYHYVIVKPESEVPENLATLRSFVYDGGYMVLAPVYFNDYDVVLEPWVVNIFVEGPGLFDWENQLGMAGAASAGYDPDFDIPEPPLPPSDYMQLYFPHPEWEVPIGPNFSTDIRDMISLDDTIVSWEFEVATDLADIPVFIDFFEGSNPPEVSTFILEDLTLGRIQDLNESPIYDYESGVPEIHRFRLHIGNGSNHSMTQNFSAGWHLFSLPIEPLENTIWDVIGSVATQNFYVYEYVSVEGYLTVDRLYEGYGYWLATLGELELQIEGEASTGMAPRYLDFGWNMIGHPFITERWLSSIRIELNGDVQDYWSALSSGWISSGIYGFGEGSYHQEDFLSPWKGYWIFALEFGLNFYIEYDDSDGGANTRDTRSEEEWYLNLLAHQGENADLITQIGVHPEATDGFDPALDAPEPPQPPSPNAVSSYFVHSTWNEYLGSRYNRDIRAPLLMDNQNSWEMTVKANPGETLLTWEYDVGDFPDHLRFMLTDVQRDTTINILDSEGYQFESSSTEALFIITAIRSTAGLGEVIMPEDYILSQNYPNPFNPQTTIKFGLPEASNVRLTIFNVKGQEVALLVDRNQPAGWHEIKWNGRNDSGETLETGIYFTRLKAGSKSKVIKMLYLK